MKRRTSEGRERSEGGRLSGGIITEERVKEEMEQGCGRGMWKKNGRRM